MKKRRLQMEKQMNRTQEWVPFSLLSSLFKSGKEQLDYFFKYSELRNIMKKEKLTTYFQPIVSLDEHKIVGYEALNRPPQSKHFPTTESFYDYIGNTDQVFLYDLFCRNTSLKRFSSNVNTMPEEREKLLFINIHPEILIDENYRTGETIQRLQEFGLKPNQIIFELTERKAVSDFEMFERVMYNYRAQGFRLAIDDVGSGYNSLKTLVHLKPEFIKLDRSLINNIVHNEMKQKIVELLLEYAIRSNTLVIAEGIERKIDLDFLKEKQIHYGQGYIFGKPHPSIKKVHSFISEM